MFLILRAANGTALGLRGKVRATCPTSHCLDNFLRPVCRKNSLRPSGSKMKPAVEGRLFKRAQFREGAHAAHGNHRSKTIYRTIIGVFAFDPRGPGARSFPRPTPVRSSAQVPFLEPDRRLSTGAGTSCCVNHHNFQKLVRGILQVRACMHAFKLKGERGQGRGLSHARAGVCAT